MRSDNIIFIGLIFAIVIVFGWLIASFPTADDVPNASGVEQLFAPGRE